MGAEVIRVFSDVHYTDKSSRVRDLEQIRPLFEGATSLVFNGDTLDTRPSDHPEDVEKARGEVLSFLDSTGIPYTLLTGNHDPDLSAKDSLDLADGRILVTHGDVLFDNIVPWSKHAPMIRNKVIAALAALPDGQSSQFECRLKAFRAVAGSLKQTHQMEKNPVKYVIRLAGDTIWPPHRFLSILRAWNEAPERAAALATRHRPKARFVMIGHTHRPGVWTTSSGIIVINTGSLCRPFGAMSADITKDLVRVSRLVQKDERFHRGPVVAEFPLT